MKVNPESIVGKTQLHLATSGKYAGVLHAEVVSPFQDLVDQAAGAGFDLRVISGYRSFDRQLAIWNAKARGQRKVLDDLNREVPMEALPDLEKVQAIMRFSALPGGSRHHWGTDMDIYDAAAVEDGYQVQLTPSETKEGGVFYELHQWLDQVLPETGFYRPYDVDRGGVAIEPWHLSYRLLADEYASALDVNVLMDSHQGVRIELMDCIHANIHTLFSQYVN